MNTTLLISGYFFRFFITLMCGLYISPSGLDHVRSVYLIPRPILHGRYISPRVPDLVNQYILPAYMTAKSSAPSYLLCTRASLSPHPMSYIFRTSHLIYTAHSVSLSPHPAPHFLRTPCLTYSAPRVSFARHLRSLIPHPGGGGVVNIRLFIFLYFNLIN